METEVRERRATWGTFEWSDFEEMFLERLAPEDFSDATVLDIGTGSGRLALYLAPRARRVLAVDVDETALERGRARAAELGIHNVRFIIADANTSDYRQLAGGFLDCIVANHFMSEEAIRASSASLRTGGRFLFACHHRDHWMETGRAGRYSFGEERMRDLLAAAGFATAFLGVERLIVAYKDIDEVAAAHPDLEAKFRADARWDTLANRFGRGSAQLTWATLIGLAAKP